MMGAEGGQERSTASPLLVSLCYSWREPHLLKWHNERPEAET